MDPLKENGAGPENRFEPRKIAEAYYSVEFAFKRDLPLYQFKVRDMSPGGLGILANEGSAALKRLAVGDVLEMKYNPVNREDSAVYLKTEIRHITRLEQSPFKGHYLVGIQVLEDGVVPGESE